MEPTKQSLTVTRVDGYTISITVPEGCEYRAHIAMLAQTGGFWCDDIFTPMSAILKIERTDV